MTLRSDDTSTPPLLVLPAPPHERAVVPAPAGTHDDPAPEADAGTSTWGLVWRTVCGMALAAVVGWVGTLLLLSGPGGHLHLPGFGPVGVGPAPRPAAEVAALADDMFLTAAGRDLLYRSRPQLLGAAEFTGACPGASMSDAGGWMGIACYRSVTRGPYVTASIVVHRPADPRLHGLVVTMTAHELLHGAWQALTPDERDDAGAVLERVVAGIDPADDIHAQIAGSVRTAPESRTSELFAYVGTQVWQPGGLDPRLEALYARTIRDREALVGVHAAHLQEVDRTIAEAFTAQDTLSARRTAADAEQQHLDAATEAVARSRTRLEQEDGRLATMPAHERARWRLSWTWHDGTTLPAAPAEQTLAEVRARLDRDEAELAARAERLRAERQALVTEEERVAALVADAQAMVAVVAPAAVAQPVEVRAAP